MDVMLDLIPEMLPYQRWCSSDTIVPSEIKVELQCQQTVI